MVVPRAGSCAVHTALIVLALSACASGGRATGGTDAPSAGYRHTSADVRFMSDMIRHHAQAIVMAHWASTHGAGSAVRVLAGRIINGQSDEIATMQQWLRDRQQPVPESGAAGAASAHATHDMSTHDTPMHGMLSNDELAQLDAARGTEFDRLFLRFMIQHHRGAVAMVEQLFSTDGAAQDQTVFKFASDVNVDQTTEIARMERMLAALIFRGVAP